MVIISKGQEAERDKKLAIIEDTIVKMASDLAVGEDYEKVMNLIKEYGELCVDQVEGLINELIAGGWY